MIFNGRHGPLSVRRHNKVEGSRVFFFSSRRRHTRFKCDWSSDVCSSDLPSPILAAGGIVLGEGSRPRIAIVRLRRDKSWVLPKGKLYPGEHALAAARREVLEETGHEVSVHANRPLTP